MPDDKPEDPQPRQPWGYVVDGAFRALPKPPMLLAGMGPPPFDVKLPSGEVRHVIAGPAASPEDPDHAG